MSIEEYYGAFTRITSQLISMTLNSHSGCESYATKENYEARTFIFQFVMGLGHTQLLGRPTPMLHEALTNLIAEETHIHSLATPTVPVTHTCVLASQQRGSSRGPSLGDVFSSHCKKSGHTADHCFALHPELLAEYRKRFSLQQQRRASTRRFTTAAVTESEPPAKRASVSAVSQSSSGAAQPWVLDSRASFHMTSDRSQLVSCQSVKDGASVQTANGSSEQEDRWNWPSS